MSAEIHDGGTDVRRWYKRSLVRISLLSSPSILGLVFAGVQSIGFAETPWFSSSWFYSHSMYLQVGAVGLAALYLLLGLFFLVIPKLRLHSRLLLQSAATSFVLSFLAGTLMPLF